jgi:AraC family transcriptional regulator, arabinose operon regulatory protein
MRRRVQTKRKTKSIPRRFEDVQWLNAVREVRHSLDSTHPISVREVHITSGEAAPQPTVSFPERHPFCEFNITLDGLLTQFVGDEKVEHRPGDILLLGPGVPHYAFRHSYPHHTLTVYFLPLVLFEMGPDGDGAWLLSRFAAPQRIDQRVIRLPGKRRLLLLERMQAISREFRERQPGSELRLWGMLIETLVDLLRWEVASGRWRTADSHPRDWSQLEKALRYLHDHFAEPLYVDQVATAIGATPNRLRELFRKTLGMSCSHYLHSLRIAQAKSRLCLPDAQVTEIALSVGFETLSHFNTSFRKLTGMSPTQYVRTLPR